MEEDLPTAPVLRTLARERKDVNAMLVESCEQHHALRQRADVGGMGVPAQ